LYKYPSKTLYRAPPWLQRALKKLLKFLLAHNGEAGEDVDVEGVHMAVLKETMKIRVPEAADEVALKDKGEDEVAAIGTVQMVAAHLHKTREKHQQSIHQKTRLESASLYLRNPTTMQTTTARCALFAHRPFNTWPLLPATTEHVTFARSVCELSTRQRRAPIAEPSPSTSS
jgi:hypothetical protein